MEAVIIDLIVVCVLVGFTIYGVYRGLFRALAGLLTVVLALVGAGLFARTLTPKAVDLLAPAIESRMTSRVDEALASSQGEKPSQVEHQVPELLGLLGLDQETVKELGKRAEQQIRETGESLVSAVVESLMFSILYGILFLLAFLALLLAFRILARAMDLVLKLPGLHGLNAIGGGLAGLLEGGLLLFLLIWVARRFGVSFEKDWVDATHVLRFFTTNTPLGVLSFLQ